MLMKYLELLLRSADELLPCEFSTYVLLQVRNYTALKFLNLEKFNDISSFVILYSEIRISFQRNGSVQVIYS